MAPCPSNKSDKVPACDGYVNGLWTLDSKAALFVKASGRCMDINGAAGPAVDVWDCNRQVLQPINMTVYVAMVALPLPHGNRLELSCMSRFSAFPFPLLLN